MDFFLLSLFNFLPFGFSARHLRAYLTTLIFLEMMIRESDPSMEGRFVFWEGLLGLKRRGKLGFG